MSECDQASLIAALRDKVVRLQKINAALIARAEHASEDASSDFGVFQATVLLEDQIRSRTQALKSALRRLEASNRALNESHVKFQAIFDLLPNPAALSSVEDNTLLNVSRSFADFFAYGPDEMIGKRTDDEGLGLWCRPDELIRYRAAVVAAAGKTVKFQGQARRRNGRTATVVICGRMVSVAGKRFLMSDLRDVTEETRQGEHLRSLSEHDPLTGLPNRRLVLTRLSQEMIHARNNGSQLAVCYLDLDGFKTINDRFGHDAGDQVLVETARRLLSVVRGSDTVARLGGDEFAILLPGLAASGEFDDILGRMLAAIRRPYMYDGSTIDCIGASIGFTVFPDDDASAEDLMRHADRSMYAVKHSGKNHYRRFAHDMPQRSATTP